MRHFHDAIVDDTVRRDKAIEVSNFELIVPQRCTPRVGHAPAGRVENGIRPAGVPDLCAAAGMHIEVRESFANQSDLQPDAA